MMTAPPPYDLSDSSDEDADNSSYTNEYDSMGNKIKGSKLMIELKEIYNNRDNKINEELKKGLLYYFPSPTKLKSTALTNNNYTIFKIFTDNGNKLSVNNDTKKKYTSIMCCDDKYSIVLSDSSFYSASHKHVSSSYIFDIYEVKCKELGYTYVRTKSDIKIIW